MTSPHPRIAIIIYSIRTGWNTRILVAEAEKKGIKERGGEADIYQVSETLSADILQKMHSPPKPNYPIANPDTMLNYDAFLFGIPTRYGNMPAQLKAFWDATGKLWAKGQLAGKYAGVFVSTSSAGGGQEMTPLTFMSTLVHQGMLFVPLGYATGLAQLVSLEHVHGGSPWGAGTFAASDGSRVPTELEMDIAQCQGAAFYQTVSRVNW